MRSSSKGVRYAVLGYLLIASVVIGGMTWATVATWQLSELRLRDEHLNQLRGALSRLDDYARSIWRVEAGHEAEHYQSLFSPGQLYNLDGSFEENPARFAQLSPLARYAPRFDWIDGYFQVNEHGVWSSPQVPTAREAQILDDFEWNAATSTRAWLNLQWLRRTVSVEDLQDRVRLALERDRLLSGGSEDPESAPRVETLASAPALSGGRDKSRIPVRQPPAPRIRSLKGSQQKYVPEPTCVPMDVANRMVGAVAATSMENVEAPSQQPGSVDLMCSALVPIWLDTGDSPARKIAFVRAARTASDTLYQGFVGDWERLKRELFKRIVEVFPKAELEPVIISMNSDMGDASVLSDDEMVELPIRLRVPSALADLNAKIWQSERGVLLTSWGAAFAVLIAAGWGVRNLVSLTERRLQFAYAVTHELRTPLTTFRLYTDLLSAGLVPEGKRQEYLDTLNQESQRLATLVEDVLEYARLENHKVRLNPVALSGRGLIERLRDAMETRCRANGITAQTKNDVPESRTLRTDVDLVSQIAGVLVNNACRHARQSPKPTVLLHLGSENGHLTLDVVDTGPGIDRADSRKIFKPFRRGRNADATAQGGIGLGLALARSWANLLGGRLDLVARRHPEYGGAHFRLTVPSEVQSTPLESA